MSDLSGLDSADTGPEENPDPEEDADWCEASHAVSTETPCCDGDSHGDDPEAISSEVDSLEVASSPSNQRDQAESENEQAPMQGEVETNSLPSAEANPLPPSAEDGERPPSLADPEEDLRDHSSSSGLVEGDSFEQDENLAAPEDENDAIEDTSCESDQQLMGAQLLVAGSDDSRPVDISAELSPAPSEAAGSDGASVAIVPNVPVGNESECVGVGDGDGEDIISHNFSGDVKVDNCAGVDAPEDDFRIDHSDLSTREGMPQCMENGGVSGSVESLAAEGDRMNEVVSEVGRDSQVPECDRNEEVVLSNSGANSVLASPSVGERLSSNDSVNVGGESEHNQAAGFKEAEGIVSAKHCEDIQSNSVELSQANCQSPEHSNQDDTSGDRKHNRASHNSEHESSPASASPSHIQDQLPLKHSAGSSPAHPYPSTGGGGDHSSPLATNPTPSDWPPCQPNNTQQSLPSSPSPSSPKPPSSPLKSDDGTHRTATTDVTAPSTTTSSLPSPAKDNRTVAAPNTTRTSSNNNSTSNNSNTTSNTPQVRTTPEGASNVGNANSTHSSQSSEATATTQSDASRLTPLHRMTLSPDDIQKQLSLALSKDDDDDDVLDDIMSELDAELSRSSPQRFLPGQHSPHRSHFSHTASTSNSLGGKDRAVNGMVDAEFKLLQDHNRQLLEQLMIRDSEIKKLSEEKDSMKTDLTRAQTERAQAAATQSNHNADDLYLPQIKELENTIVQQQKEIQATRDKLKSHDSAAKRAVTTLQEELKIRVDQVTKQYEEAVKEKDSMVVMFASSESRVMESKRAYEKMELRLRDAMREKDGMLASMKAAKADRQKAVNGLEHKCNELSNVHKEMEKLKEALSSSEYRIRWFQNKLKEELEVHKETKTNLEKTTNKLKENKEETEILRKECQSIVKTYQESEEIKSNSLDKELKEKECQLKLQMQEFSDTEENRQRTKRELESLKEKHKEVVSQVTALKQEYQRLENSVAEKECAITQSNEMLNKQKADITDMTSKLRDKRNLDEDFARAQEMIETLDRDISELKLTNRDLQKDMDSCRERESKMLALQSELSRTNACLRSENTTLSNKSTNQTAEVERLKMEIQELETTTKHLTDAVEEEKRNSSQTTTKLKASLDEKTKESCDFKQKWEDEMDSNKTLKRRHANNIKDLTRQLQQTKRRLEIVEGSRKDSGGSMGSRTNSNGSLNSMADSGQPSGQHAPQSGTASTASANSQEFPVITEQVEIDKQVLIERIVRLQKSHARKNEKLEFLGEHIQQLLEEIKKKTKIIQSYVMREEAGTLSSEDMDANKSLLSRKGGIMASVYSLHQQDGNMTLELSLQINKKLQAVLEDTLLKNITLKENLDTLGEEIARLSQVNRKLQLHLQDLENTKKT